MCGIFGYIGKQKERAAQICVNGLQKLEYRGYDSAGIVGLRNGELLRLRVTGKVAQLDQLIQKNQYCVDTAIAHTRWATHGEPTERNAHPHFDNQEKLAVVHNGIIENHTSLRRQLKEKGFTFFSDTDTEVIAQLISSLYNGDLLKAVQGALSQLEGSLAIAVTHQDHPNEIVAAAKQSPLAVGLGEGETFIASDTSAFLAHTSRVLYLENAEVAHVTVDGCTLYDCTGNVVEKEAKQLDLCATDVSKGEYEHYTLKEIFEQPQTIRNAYAERLVEKEGTAHFEGITLSKEELSKVKRIVILACGTSWHAGLVASYLIEEMVRIPVKVEISSEFRYKNPIIDSDTLAIVISQSGETADTIAAMHEVKSKGAKVVALCNVQGSTIAREADALLLLRAGPEIGVCSTKAFTSQLTLLSLFSLMMARLRKMNIEQGKQFLKELKSLPEAVEKVLASQDQIARLAKKYAHFENFFFLGRHLMYPTCLEGALKLKEIAYVNANGYPSGEMKHGPIALISPECPTVACCANDLTKEKMLTNLMEIKARRGLIVAIAPEGMDGVGDIADDLIWVPAVSDAFAPIVVTVATQLFAYHFAYQRGAEIDQPRNLAKSVTVE